MCCTISSCPARPGALLLVPAVPAGWLVLWCWRCDRVLQPSSCPLGGRAEGALHMLCVLQSCLFLPAMVFSQQQDTFDSHSVCSCLLCSCSHSRCFPSCICADDHSHVQMFVFAFLICLLFLCFNSFFLLFWITSPWSCSILTPASYQPPCSPSQRDIIHKSNVHSLFSWSRIQHWLVPDLAQITRNQLSTPFHFDNCPPSTISRWSVPVWHVLIFLMRMSYKAASKAPFRSKIFGINCSASEALCGQRRKLDWFNVICSWQILVDNYSSPCS